MPWVVGQVLPVARPLPRSSPALVRVRLHPKPGSMGMCCLWRWAALAWPPWAEPLFPTPSSRATPRTCLAAWGTSTTSVPVRSTHAMWWSRPSTTVWVMSRASAAAPGPTATSPRYWAGWGSMQMGTRHQPLSTLNYSDGQSGALGLTAFQKPPSPKIYLTLCARHQ